ncbi:lipase family alpha/beta hydrolase [Allosphingosinicella sp.]|jgi:pimeloyl-ACP methyl ester carboxylesterase|uniref:lipase family alpha/beta hydrolase n=1 Tax=Allosphingosinicella sp. TaxID=2823234 RepID=UPI002F24D7F5
MLAKESAALLSRVWRSFGRLVERGPADGPRLMVIPGFLANDRTTLGLQRALARAGYRVTGWGLGLNTGVQADTLDRIVERAQAFGGGRPIVLVGWSLGGIYAREAAKLRPDLVERVVTLGSPFSGDRRSNNVWRLYELVAGHPVDDPPIETDTAEKPPVPTLAVWSRGDGIVAVAAARGQDGERDCEIELRCSHMGFAVSGRTYPAIVEAVKGFCSSPRAEHGGRGTTRRVVEG